MAQTVVKLCYSLKCTEVFDVKFAFDKRMGEMWQRSHEHTNRRGNNFTGDMREVVSHWSHFTDVRRKQRQLGPWLDWRHDCDSAGRRTRDG